MLKLLIITLFISFSTTIHAESGWQLAQDKENIKIYTRINRKNGIKDFLAEVVINRPLEQVVKAFKHPEDHGKWFHLRKLTKILKRPDEQTFIIYSITDAPWPVSDRDAVVRYHFEKQSRAEHIHISVDSIKGEVPLQEDLVRIPFLHSWWKLDAKSKNQTRIRFFNSSDVGGNIPVWLANSGVIDMPFNSLSTLKKLMESGQLSYD